MVLGTTRFLWVFFILTGYIRHIDRKYHYFSVLAFLFSFIYSSGDGLIVGCLDGFRVDYQICSGVFFLSLLVLSVI